MDYGALTNEIAKIIKEDYLKQYLKISKTFQIITVGYNASKYKTLQAFTQHGWKLHTGLIDYDNGNMDFMFEYYEPTIKMSVAFYMLKNLKTGTLSDDGAAEKGTIYIYVDKTDKLFDLVKESVTINNYYSFSYKGDEKIFYNIITKNDGGYMITFACSKY